MLKVNLLPPERRQREGTPLPRFIILLVGVALISSEVAVGAWGYIKWQNLVEEKTSLQEEKGRLQKSVDKFEELKKQISRLKKRKEVLNEIRPPGKKEKYQWSYSLDQLFTVIDQSPGVWISNLKGQMGDRGGQGAGASLSLSFQTKAAKPLGRLTNFQKLMKRRLIEGERVFTNLERVWRSYNEGEEQEQDVKRGFWQAQYTLKRAKK